MKRLLRFAHRPAIASAGEFNGPNAALEASIRAEQTILRGSARGAPRAEPRRPSGTQVGMGSSLGAMKR